MRATLVMATLLVVVCATYRANAQEEGVPLVFPKSSDKVVPEAAGDGKASQLLGAEATFDHAHPTKPSSRHHGSGDSAASISDFDGYHGAGIVAACVGLILAAGGGIGGGGILVPIYILIMRFSARYGIPLSNVTILGGALANNAFNMQKRHPNKNVNRPVIDFDLVLLMEPPTIAGAVIGSILNKVLPEFVITTLLVIVLGATTLRTWQSAEKQAAKEAAAAAAAEAGEDKALIQKEAAPVPDAPNGPSDEGSGGGGSGSTTVDEAAIAGSDAEPTGIWATLLKDNGEQFPWWKIGAITGCFLLVVATNVAKLHATECGSAGYWFLMLLPVILTVGMMLAVRVYLLRKTEYRKARGDELIEGDVNWDDRTTITYPALCTLSGLFAGMFGIGGGIVKGPLMIEMGVLPEVSASTAAFMIFYTASSATVTFASFGTVQWSFAGILFALGFFCTCIGQYAVNQYIKQTGRSSVIVYIICGIVGLSTILMGYESGLLAYHDIDKGKAGFGTLCQ
jgi:uncharacterized membrane protein YfcA